MTIRYYKKMEEKKSWGGKRENSGRKKGKKITYITITLPKEEIELLKLMAKDSNMTVSHLISERFSLKAVVKALKEEEERNNDKR